MNTNCKLEWSVRVVKYNTHTRKWLLYDYQGVVSSSSSHNGNIDVSFVIKSGRKFISGAHFEVNIDKWDGRYVLPLHSDSAQNDLRTLMDLTQKHQT